MSETTSSPARPRASSFLRELFTERDNQTADLKRVLWAIGFGWALGLETFLVVCRKQPFDLLSAATALGLLLAAGGGTLALNRRNENGAPGA